MLRSTSVSQIPLILLLIMGSLVLSHPVAAMQGWGYFHVVDTFGSSLTLKVPAGLTSDYDSSAGLLSLGTTKEVINTSNHAAIRPGQWGIGIGALPIAVVEALGPANQIMRPQLVLDTIMDQMETSVAGLVFTRNTETLTIANHPAAQVRGRSAQGDALVIVVDLETAYLLATAVTASGEQPLFEPLILSIIESAEYTP